MKKLYGMQIFIGIFTIGFIVLGDSMYSAIFITLFGIISLYNMITELGIIK